MLPPQVASYLKIKTQTLAKWRLIGYGPVYFNAGRSIRYRRSAVDEWIKNQQISNTSMNPIRRQGRP
ncbi:helix-turn-helix domain-containing protein [Oharaeibacter diazotrophicus]